MNDEEARKCLEIARAALAQKDYAKVSKNPLDFGGGEIRSEESAAAGIAGGAHADAASQVSFLLRSLFGINKDQLECPERFGETGTAPGGAELHQGGCESAQV